MSLVGKGGMDQLLFGLGTGDISYSSSNDISTTFDIFCDSFSVTGGSTVLTCYGNRIFARKEILIGSGAKLKADGFNASGHTGGGSPGFGVGGTLSSGGQGGNGGSNGPGSDGQDGANGSPAGGAGGDGGTGGSNPGGTGAIIIGTPPLFFGKNLDSLAAMQGWVMGQSGSVKYLAGGRGGGGGGASTSNGGGGGGAGGNVIILAAPTIRIEGTISAKGGNGGAGNGAGSNGGGGGGGGGLVILVYSELILDGTIDVSGGLGGAGGGGGAAGANGSDGHIYHVTALSTALGPIV